MENEPKSTDRQDEQAPAYPDWREMRRQEREARRAERRAWRGSGMSGSWIGGGILILLGLIFLLQNLGALYLQNWWALFILIPAFGAFTSAWNIYRNSGNRMTAAVRGPLIGGLVLLAVTIAFLFNLNFSLFWPILLILGGIALVFSVLLPG